MKKNVSVSPDNSAFLVNICITVSGLLFLWSFKYHSQELSFNEFNAKYIGNVLNALFVGFYLLGYLIYYFKNSAKIILNPRWIVPASMTGLVFLLAAKLLAFFSFPSNSYIFDQPMKKVLIGAGYLIYQYLLIYWTLALWFAIFGVKNVIHLRSFINSFLLLAALLCFSFFYSAPRSENLYIKAGTSYQYGVVLGAAVWSHNRPSPILVSRTERAHLLYQGEVIKSIYLTGSNAPGEIAESEAAFNYLKQFNIPLNDIHLEKQTTCTTEQVRFIQEELLNQKPAPKILIISDKYHAQRIKDIVSFYKLKVDILGTDINLSFEKNLSYRLRESVALLIFWLFGI
ncbi:MAG: YdcF family protein [Ignavibacteria bacterium]|nr:YdcF family protein [Ignavibacteria bacterium]